MTPDDGPVLCLDAGQTGSRAALSDAPRHVIALPHLITDTAVVGQLADLTGAALSQLGSVASVAIGSSGLPDSGGAAELLGLLDGTGVRSVLLTHDSITNFLGTLGARNGVVVAAGTGVVTLAVGAHAVARVDGWGYLIGDAGSGYWIGRAGLDAVLRAFDGRGEPTALTEVARAEFPVLSEAYLTLQKDESKVSRIAAYARPVIELADRDEVCAQICRRAASELAWSALSGLRRVGLGDQSEILVGMGGRILASPVIATAFRDEILTRHPTAVFVPASGASLRGAALLRDLPERSALWTRIDRAAR